MLNFFKLVFLVALLSGCTETYSCKLEIVGPSPLFTKDFGSKTIAFRAHGEEMLFEHGETIHTYCNDRIIIQNANGLSINSFNERAAAFSCDETSIEVLGNSYGDTVRVSCSSEATLSLYESGRKLPNCATFMSYAIGFKLPDVGDVIKAGVCYDLERLTLKFATYFTHHKNVLILDKFTAGSELAVDLKQKVSGFKNYFDFINQYSLDDLRKSSFNPNEFHFASLLQNEPLNTELEDYTYIFNTMWWRQLRQENWRYFLDALHERTWSAKYLVYMGTYGNITIPAAEGNCSSFSEVVSVRKGDMVVQAPAYIWSYLKSITPGDTEEFVVIGHNSPYTRNPGHSEFCSVDMCDDIAWLKDSKFGNLRRLPALGYTFCCQPEEVAKVIDNFPLKGDEVEATTKPTMLEIMEYPDIYRFRNL